MISLLPVWRIWSWIGEGWRKLGSEEWKGSLRWQDKSRAVGWGGEWRNIRTSSASQHLGQPVSGMVKAGSGTEWSVGRWSSISIEDRKDIAACILDKRTT